MIFLMQFEINKHCCKFLLRPQIALTRILLVFEKFTRACLFQIALTIMWLLIQINYVEKMPL